MGHEHERDPDLALDALELELHRLAEFEVERRQWLVEQERTREVDERPCECDTLLLSTRQLCRFAVGELCETDHVEHLGHVRLVLALGDLLRLRSEAHVLGDRHVREERVLLEHGVDIALVRRDPTHVDAVEQHLARRRLLEPGDHLQGGGLAAAGRTEHGEELTLLDAEVGLLDRHEVAEGLADVLELDDAVAHG